MGHVAHVERRQTRRRKGGAVLLMEHGTHLVVEGEKLRLINLPVPAEDKRLGRGWEDRALERNLHANVSHFRLTCKPLRA